MSDSVLPDFDDSKARWIIAKRPTDRARRDHFELAVPTVGISVVVAPEDGLDPCFFQEIEIDRAHPLVEVEIPIGFIGAFDKIGLMLEDEDMSSSGGFGSDEFFAKPPELFLRFGRDFFRCIDELAVQDDSVDLALAKRVPVGSEGSAIGEQRIRRRYVLDIVIARDEIKRDGGFQCGRNSLKLRDLARMAHAVDEIATDDDECWLEFVRMGDRALE